MFRAFGRSFLDVFRYPLLLLYGFMIVILGSAITYGFVELFYDTLFIENLSIKGLLIYWVSEHLWIVILFLVLFFMLLYFLSIFVAYVYNTLLGVNNRFLGKEKIFGFGIFVFIISLLNMIFLFVGNNLFAIILYFIFMFFSILFLVPFFFSMPVLLVEYDLKTALSESFKFAKNRYFSILGFLILFILLSNLIFLGVDYLDLIIPDFSLIVYIFVALIMMMWQIYFIYELYHN